MGWHYGKPRLSFCWRWVYNGFPLATQSELTYLSYDHPHFRFGFGSTCVAWGRNFLLCLVILATCFLPHIGWFFSLWLCFRRSSLLKILTWSNGFCSCSKVFYQSWEMLYMVFGRISCKSQMAEVEFIKTSARADPMLFSRSQSLIGFLHHSTLWKRSTLLANSGIAIATEGLLFLWTNP